MKTSVVIPLAIVAAGVILAGAVYLSMKSDAPSTSSGSGNPSAVRPVDATDHILGNPAAKVKIVEYSDFDCPHCKAFDATLHQIVNDYGTSGNVAWVMRNLPITEIHPNAKKEAEAAECVAQNAGSVAYFKFTDLLFANQPSDPANFAQYAQASGADPSAVAACIQSAASNGVDALIDAERQNGIDAGAEGTPYSLILTANQTPVVIDGDWAYADLKDTLDAILQALQ